MNSEKERGKLHIESKSTMLVLGVCLIAYSVLMYILFYHQTIQHNSQDFMSDMEAYLLTMLGQESGFDFPYPIYFMVGKFFLLFTNVEVAGALATMVLNSLSPLILFYFLNKIIAPWYAAMGKKAEAAGGIFTVLLTFSFFFLSMLYSPKGIYLPGLTHKYLGVFSPNPFHNATYMAARPFTIVTFFLFVDILDYYEERTDWKEFGLFSLFLFLSTMTKPSFTLVLVSTAGLVMAGRIFYRKWRNFIPSIKLGLMFVPTFAVMLYQFGGVFGQSSHAGAEGGIGFAWAAAWHVYMENIPFAIVLALAFPGLVLVLNLKELKTDTRYRFSWEMTIVSILELLLLYEKGDRFIHTNFSWGYMCAMFFVFVTSIILLMKNTLQKRQHIVLLCMQWGAFLWHLICGIIYFIYIYQGNNYYSW